MKDHENTGSLVCYWSNLKENPSCIHGPGILFGREENNEIKKFYVCSACRDRKLCPFYFEFGRQQTKQQKQVLYQEKKTKLLQYNHQKLFIKFNQLLIESPTKRAYCHTCERLFSILDKHKHSNHDIVQDISDYSMMHPSELLKPLDDSKKEAQYLFSKRSVEDIIKMLTDLNAESVLCIGTPRIHEYINENLQGRISSLLLDFDGRFHNFFGPLNYCWYNLFNNHFLQENSESVFKEFLKQNKGKNMFLVCDPPFGGRVEPMSQTIKAIQDLHKRLNQIACAEDQLKVFFIFPYFMEAVMKEKSNPPNIDGGLKELNMSDYKVEYDNHPLFVLKDSKQKQGSQVRLFTNVNLSLIKLPESEGYKYCKRCQKWVASENKHCKMCHACTSKDGRRYRHCKLCQRCVKPTWQHCKTCDRCAIPNHKCGQKPKIGNCFKCDQSGHTEKECSTIVTKASISSKRRSDNSNDRSCVSVKKQKNKVDKKRSEIKENANAIKFLEMKKKLKNNMTDKRLNNLNKKKCQE